MHLKYAGYYEDQVLEQKQTDRQSCAFDLVSFIATGIWINGQEALYLGRQQLVRQDVLTSNANVPLCNAHRFKLLSCAQAARLVNARAIAQLNSSVHAKPDARYLNPIKVQQLTAMSAPCA